MSSANALNDKVEHLMRYFNNMDEVGMRTALRVALQDADRWADAAMPPDVERRLAPWLTNGAALHPLTINLVVRFARAMAAKLSDAEDKYGYSDGWISAAWMDECRAQLMEHVGKGDPRDVAAYCAFLWHHGESTATPKAASNQGLTAGAVDAVARCRAAAEKLDAAMRCDRRAVETLVAEALAILDGDTVFAAGEVVGFQDWCHDTGCWNKDEICPRNPHQKQRPLYTTSRVPSVDPFDMLAHLARQRTWSEKTFGPDARTKGVVDHIRKELLEIEADPEDLMEWIDVVILALDGAWRAGGTPEQIVSTMVAKQTKNEGRSWPDWRTAPPDKAIEHVRTVTPIRQPGEPS